MPTGLEKWMYTTFQREINSNDADIMTIKYYVKRPEVTKSGIAWEKTDGVVWQYNNIRVLRERISSLTLGDMNLVNLAYGKNNFFCRYTDCDFNVRYEKKFITLIDSFGKEFPIDDVEPIVKIGKSWLAWMLVQK
jgi:hypothetical protein